MKKLILIALLTLFNINFVNSDFKNQEYSNIEKNIYNIENRIKEIQSKDVESKELIELQNKLWDYIYELNIKKWNSINYKDLIENSSKLKNKVSQSNGVTLETWDIIVINFKNKPWWSFFSNWREHTWIVYDTDIVEAVRYWENSRKISLENFFDIYTDQIDKMIIIKMDLNDIQKILIKNSIDNSLLNKPYPSNSNILSSKYSMDTFYCSSLVWRAHYTSGSFVDLDEKYSPWMVFPIELVISDNVWSLYSVNF